MPPSSQFDRTHLHALVDRIPPYDLRAVEKVLRAFAEDEDPVMTALRNAPMDSEPCSDHEMEGLAEYKAGVLRGERLERAQPDDLLRQLGFEDAGK